MRTVHEVSKFAGVSIRTLQYYDRIGLLRPAGYTEAGYRLYDDTDLTRLQQILLFRELEFPLRDIKKIMESPDLLQLTGIKRAAAQGTALRQGQRPFDGRCLLCCLKKLPGEALSDIPDGKGDFEILKYRENTLQYMTTCSSI